MPGKLAESSAATRTTGGAGQRHEIEIWFGLDDTMYLVSATARRRLVRNLQADPSYRALTTRPPGHARRRDSDERSGSAT